MSVSSTGSNKAEREEQELSLRSFLRAGAGFGGSKGGGTFLSRIPSSESVISDQVRLNSNELSSGQSSPTFSPHGDTQKVAFGGSLSDNGLAERMTQFDRLGSDSSSVASKKAGIGTAVQLNKSLFVQKHSVIAQVCDELKILRDLEGPLKEEVMAMFTSHRYSAGKCVIEKGELFSSYFVVLEGSVGLFVKDEEDQDDSMRSDYSTSGRYAHRERDSVDSGKGDAFQPHKFSSGGSQSGSHEMFKGILKRQDGSSAKIVVPSEDSVKTVTKRNMKKLSKVVKNKSLVQTLKAKATLGEISLVAPMPSMHTVRAMEETTILQLNAMDFYIARQRYFRNVFEERMKLLEHAPFASMLTPDMMANLADSCQTCRYENGDNITCEANEDSSQKFFMIMDGQAALLRPIKGESETSEFTGDWSRVRMVETFLPNSCFGQDALEDPTIDMDIEKVRLSPTIVAVKRCTCISIDRGTFRSLVGSYETIMAELNGEKQKKKASSLLGVASAALMFRGASMRKMARGKSSVLGGVEEDASVGGSAWAPILGDASRQKQPASERDSLGFSLERKVSPVAEEQDADEHKTVPAPMPARGVGGGGGGGVSAEAKWRQTPSVVSWASSTHLARVSSGLVAGDGAGPARTDDGQAMAGEVEGGGACAGDDEGGEQAGAGMPPPLEGEIISLMYGHQDPAWPRPFANMPSVVTWARPILQAAGATKRASSDISLGFGSGGGAEEGHAVSPDSLMQGLELVRSQQEGRVSSSGAAVRMPSVGSAGSRAKTPGGGVALDPEGADRIPSHFSPAVTPLQSRQGSRMMSRGSGGSGERTMSRGARVGAMIQGEFSPGNINSTVMEGPEEEGNAFVMSDGRDSEEEDSDQDWTRDEEDEAHVAAAHRRKRQTSPRMDEVVGGLKLPHLKDATSAKTPSKEWVSGGWRSGSRGGVKSTEAEGLSEGRSTRSSRGRTDLDMEVYPCPACLLSLSIHHKTQHANLCIPV